MTRPLHEQIASADARERWREALREWSIVRDEWQRERGREVDRSGWSTLDYAREVLGGWFPGSEPCTPDLDRLDSLAAAIDSPSVEVALWEILDPSAGPDSLRAYIDDQIGHECCACGDIVTGWCPERGMRVCPGCRCDRCGSAEGPEACGCAEAASGDEEAHERAHGPGAV